MGLMDRDYYREKKPERESPLERIKRNPYIAVAIALLLLFLILYLI